LITLITLHRRTYTLDLNEFRRQEAMKKLNLDRTPIKEKISFLSYPTATGIKTIPIGHETIEFTSFDEDRNPEKLFLKEKSKDQWMEKSNDFIVESPSHKGEDYFPEKDIIQQKETNIETQENIPKIERPILETVKEEKAVQHDYVILDKKFFTNFSIIL